MLKESMKRKQEDEFRMELTGQFMALFANANRDSKRKATPFTRQDFFKLSYDKETVEERPLTFKEAKALFGSRIRRDGR